MEADSRLVVARGKVWGMGEMGVGGQKEKKKQKKEKKI